MFNRPVRPEIWTENISGRPVIGIYVTEAPAGEKPIFLKSQGLPKGAFRRIGSSDQRFTEDDLLVCVQGRQFQSYDETVIPDADLTDIDPACIQDYRDSRAETNPDAEELRWSDKDLLRSLGCLAHQDGNFVPTVAGILLFGTTKALRRCFPMMRVDYIRVPGKEWVSDPDHRFETIDMRDSLMRLVRRATAAILDDLPKAFRLPDDSLQRQDEPIIPYRVIREAIVNAIMHRNYRIHGAVQIIRYANRLEIRNWGHSLVARERLGEPGSETRNPKIAAVFHETRFAETKGSGIRVMREMMGNANLSPPTFESDREKDQFVATFLFHHFLGPDDVAWLSRFQDYHLSDAEARALIFVREMGAIDNPSYRDVTYVDLQTAVKDLRRLREVGLLELKAPGRAAYYVPTQLLLGTPAESHKQTAELQEFGAESQESRPESQEFSAESQEFPDAQAMALPVGLTQAVEKVRRTRNPKAIREVIYQLCAWKPLMAEQIARFLEREQTYLVQNYISPMVEAGELQYVFPDNPHHPRQAYRAVPKEKAP